MNYEEIRNEVVQILQSANGRFLTAYQICQKLQVSAPPLWTALVNKYPSENIAKPMGEGTGHQYSPASFIANALKHFNGNQMIQNLRQEYLDSSFPLCS